MKPKCPSGRIWLSVALLLCAVVIASAQGIGLRPSDVAKWHEGFADAFEAGKTNLPLLRVDWFGGCTLWPGNAEEMCSAWCCNVSNKGEISMGHCYVSNYYAKSSELNRTNLTLLSKAMAKLPPPPNESPPFAQKVFVSGVKSNQWFYGVYCRTNLPPEVKKLFELTGVRL